MHWPYRDLQNLKFSCLYLFPFSQKASGGGGRGVVYHTSTGQYIGVATLFFLESGLKLDEKSIENGLEGQKCSARCLFWGWLPPPNYSKKSGKIGWSKCHTIYISKGNQTRSLTDKSMAPITWPCNRNKNKVWDVKYGKNKSFASCRLGNCSQKH